MVQQQHQKQKIRRRNIEKNPTNNNINTEKKDQDWISKQNAFVRVRFSRIECNRMIASANKICQWY